MRGSGGSVMLWREFCWHGQGSLQINTKVVLCDHLYPMMKHFYPDGSGLLQDDNVSIHRARGVTGWFDEYENDVMMSPDLNPAEHL